MDSLDPEILVEFAKALLRTGDAMAAAYEVTDDTETCARLATEGKDSPVVLSIIERANGGELSLDLLPDKATLGLRIYKETRECTNTATLEARLKGYKLYAELMGFIEKPSTVVNNNNTANFNTIKAIPQTVYEDEDALQRMIELQQRKLVDGTLYTEYGEDENAA